MDQPQDAGAIGGTNPDQLTGWKEIAGYLGKAVRTVQRWERQAGLPVHRVQQVGEVVFAFRSEIDRWRDTPRGAQVLEAPADPAVASAVDPGPFVSPPEPVATPPEPPSLLAQRRPTPLNHRAGRKPLLAISVIGLLAVVALAAFGVGFGDDFALVAEPAGPQVQGKTFRMNVQGFDAANPAMRWTRLPNGREEPMRPAIQPDQNGQMQWAFSTDCNTETGTHHVWMKDESTGQPSKGAALIVLANPDCDRPMPDMAARVTGLDQASVRAGAQITVSFTIWNMGTAPAAATHTRARLSVHSTRTAVTDTSLGDSPTMALAVGASTTQSASVTIPARTKPGVYYIWVIADNGNATIEADSFNNFARSNAFVVTDR